MTTDEIGKLLRQTQTAPLSHPLPVLRAKEIDRWASSQDYQSLLQKHTIGYDNKAETKGGWRNW